MWKRAIPVLLCLCMVLSLVACGGSSSTPKTETVPESVKALQHKIDKAMETSPTNERIDEIRKEYEDLLSSEQAMVKDYDKVLAMYTVDKPTLQCITAVNTIMASLNNTNSFKLVSAGCCMVNTYVGAVQIVYKENGTKKSYHSEFTFTKDPKEDRWTCSVKEGTEKEAKSLLAGAVLGLLKLADVDENQIMNNLGVSVAHGD